MSNFNYMDNVPVKIAEKYKPPPRIYQLPQSVTNKLNLPDGHFHNCPQYSYDFQLEHKVLSKIPEYKRKRQIEREARQERRERREQERQRKVEEQHKQMLGAVSYPNAEELSSSDSEDDEDDDSEKSKTAVVTTPIVVNMDTNWLASHSFNNILQPTVLTHNGDISENNMGDALAFSYKYNNATPSNKSTGNSGNSNKLANTFNYKDFEDDTSSPFDNIELKTINDLDILRQVLHNTQLKANRETAELKDGNDVGNSCNDDNKDTKNTKELIDEALTTAADTPQIVSDMSTLENTKAALEKVDFSDINLGLEQQTQSQPQTQRNDNIPTHNYKNIGNYYSSATYGAPVTTAAVLLPSSTCYMQHYSNGMQDQRNYQVYHNQNYLYSPNCNSNAPPTTTTLTGYSNYNNASTAHAQQLQYIVNNANGLIPTSQEIRNVASYHGAPIQQMQQIQEDELHSSKSKSVPDLFQELRDEVRNSEMRRRRSRNYSHNFDGSKEVKDDEENEKDSEVRTPTNSDTEKLNDTLEAFNQLSASIQKLARNISSMGFPLARVARIAQVYGEDDKKIVEHLIPLTELLDLGFDETQISEALIKFDNNKEKALEHLIS